MRKEKKMMIEKDGTISFGRCTTFTPLSPPTEEGVGKGEGVWGGGGVWRVCGECVGVGGGGWEVCGGV